jgi:NAD(P)-dependent dehydrogenase (short-subunit alcohol dehydrogenase family)
MGRVAGKVALVTGGASGIGAAVSTLLAAEGAEVYVTDIQDPAGDDIVATIAAAGGKASYRHHDVTDEAAWIVIVNDILASSGRLDIVVNNAGIGGGGTFVDEMTLETWRHCLAINLDGVFLGVKHGVRAMKENGGSIISTSSILGFVGMTSSSNYCASKGGVRLLTKAAAIECAERGLDIRVNSIHPGFIETPLVMGAIQTRGPKFRELIESRQPTGAMGKPEDIAQGVLYLASDESKFVNGTELVIDGAYLAR